MPPTLTHGPPHSRLTHPLPNNFTIATTPGVRPEQVTLTSQPLGKGSFGSVWLGSFSGCPVAVKLCPLNNATPTALTQFRREMSRYHHLRHPCITQFFCVVQHAGKLLLVTELMKGGSLFQALTDMRNARLTRIQPNSMLRIAQHVANGLAYLHASRFSFGDLKSMNVLLSEKPNLEDGSFSPSVQAKLCDFGLSRNLKHIVTSDRKFSVFDTQIPARNGPAGTFAYLAPEAFSGLPVDNANAPKAADVYALGIVLWELATLHSPWPGKQPLQLIRVVRKEALRPPWPSNTSGIPNGYVALVERCWHQDPVQRPAVDVVAAELDRILRTLPDHVDPAMSFHERATFFRRAREEEAETTLLSSDLDAVHVDDNIGSEETDSRLADDDDTFRGLGTIKYVKSIRIGYPSGLQPCHSDISACTSAFDTRTNSQSRLTVDSFAPSVDSRSLEPRGLDMPRYMEMNMDLLRNKECRMSLISSESGPDSRRWEQLLIADRSVKEHSPQKQEYRIPTPEVTDSSNIEKELQVFEDEEELDFRRLGISMYSQPLFR